MSKQFSRLAGEGGDQAQLLFCRKGIKTQNPSTFYSKLLKFVGMS